MKKLVVTLCWVIGLMIINPFATHAETINQPPSPSKELLYQDVFISLLMPHIQRPINHYYSKLLTETPVVYPYFVDVVEVERLQGYRSFDFMVRLKVDSVVGPHISVGTDLLTFRLDSSGKVKLVKFEHIKTYELPNNWKHILKKQ